MKDVILRSFTLATSLFLFLLLSSSAFAFPSIHSNEIVQLNWSNPGSVHTSVYLEVGESYYPIERACPMIDDQPSGDPGPAAVPEPATVVLMALGLFGMGMLMRHRQRNVA